MKKFLDNIINRPFEQIDKQLGENFFFTFAREHDGKFTIIPDMIRRCHFLSSPEKEVLYELISWASTTNAQQDGYCKVTESHIRVNTGLGLSTVKKAISNLTKKGFICKAIDYDKRNIYRINPVDRNPYVIVSEWLFFLRKNFFEDASREMVDKPEINYLLSKKAYIEATMEFVKEHKYHSKYIEALRKSLNNLIEDMEEYEDITKELGEIWMGVQNELTSIYIEKFKKML
jgi:predicted transcriptional regulator